MNSYWALVFVATSLSYAQSGALTGKVLDPHQQPVASVTVCLQAKGDRQAMRSKTDAAGVYRFTVPSGDYTIRLENESNAQAVAVEDNRVTTVNLELRQVPFFDEPQFTVAGVTDNTYRGGHGSDSVLRSSEELAKATASLAAKDSEGDALERAGHPLEAVQELQRAAESDASERNLFNWGTELLSHRAPQAAGQVFAKGARLFPGSTRMLLGLASAEYEGGAYDLAANDFFKAADMAPGDPCPYLFLGKVKAQEVTSSSGYEERMKRFAHLHPDNAMANYYYASILSSRHRNPEAQAFLEKAVALEPGMGSAYLGLGSVHTSDGNYPQAIKAYQKAIELDPDLEEAHYRLAEAYRLTGDRVNAGKEIAIYRELSKQSSQKTEQERRELQQFVISLHQTNKSQ